MSVRTWRSGIVWWPSTSTTTPWTTVNTGKSISHPASASTDLVTAFYMQALSNLQFLYLSDDKTYNVFNWNIDLRYQFYLKNFFLKKIQLFVYIITSFSWCNLYPFFFKSPVITRKANMNSDARTSVFRKELPFLALTWLLRTITAWTGHTLATWPPPRNCGTPPVDSE